MRIGSDLFLLCFMFLALSSSSQVITYPSQIGINTAAPAPNVSLHIKDDFESIRLDGTSPFISFYDGLDYRGYLYMLSNNMYLYNRKAGNLIFGNNDKPQLTINAFGNIGVGISLPKVQLHVTDGNSIGPFNLNTIAGFEKGSDNGYVSILTNSDYESGLLFGDQNVAERGGIIFNNAATPKGLQFRTNSNVTQVCIDHSGDVGIGITNPTRPLHIKSSGVNNDYGLLMERAGSTVSWEVSVFNGFYNWFYNGNATPVARIETDGMYNSSDQRLKRNISPYKQVLPLLKEIHVSTYQMKNQANNSTYSLGLLAQDVIKVFPEIVRLNQNREGELYYSMDYSKVGVIAIKAVQELVQALNERDKQYTDLQHEVTSLQTENDLLHRRLEAIELLISNKEER